MLSTVIRSFGNWYQSQFGVPNFVKDIAYIKEDAPNQRVLSPDEYDKVCSSIQGQKLNIIQFFGNTGLRREEFRKLIWDNVSPDLKLLTVEGKGRKRRVIPLNATCKEILQRYQRFDGEPIPFVLRYKGRNGLTQFCQKLAKRIGIPSFGTHALRHYFATQLIKKGINIYLLSKILGHSSVKTTERIYLHLVPTDLLGTTDILDE